MKSFQFLYSAASILVVFLFLSGIVLATSHGPKTGVLNSDRILAIGMIVLGLTPILGLAILGTSWLRTQSRDIVGWVAVLLGAFTAYLWTGL